MSTAHTIPLVARHVQPVAQAAGGSARVPIHTHIERVIYLGLCFKNISDPDFVLSFMLLSECFFYQSIPSINCVCIFSHIFTTRWHLLTQGTVRSVHVSRERARHSCTSGASDSRKREPSPTPASQEGQIFSHFPSQLAVSAATNGSAASRPTAIRVSNLVPVMDSSHGFYSSRRCWRTW